MEYAPPRRCASAKVGKVSICQYSGPAGRLVDPMLDGPGDGGDTRETVIGADPGRAVAATLGVLALVEDALVGAALGGIGGAGSDWPRRAHGDARAKQRGARQSRADARQKAASVHRRQAPGCLVSRFDVGVRYLLDHR